MNCVVTGRDYHPLNPFYLDKQKPNLSDTVKNFYDGSMWQCRVRFHTVLFRIVITVHADRYLTKEPPRKNKYRHIKKKSSSKIATYPKHMYITLHLSTFFESW